MTDSKRITIRDKTTEDAYDDYSWETDPELAALDAAPVLPIPYSQYLLDYQYEINLGSSTSHQFSIDTLEGEHIGNCSYYNLDRDNSDVELGIMIGNREYWNKGYGMEAIATLLDHIFNNLPVNRVHLKTLEHNHRAQKCFRKCGFNQCGNMVRRQYRFMLMDITREQWQSRQTPATN